MSFLTIRHIKTLGCRYRLHSYLSDLVLVLNSLEVFHQELDMAAGDGLAE